MDRKTLDFIYSKYQTEFFHRFGSTQRCENFFARDRHRVTQSLEHLPAAAHRVLDAGVGPGVIFNYLNFDRNFTHVEGIDINVNNEFIELTPQQNFYLMDITQLEYDSKCFDLVICTQVLEHLETMEQVTKALAELRRVSSKTLFVTLPFEESLPLQCNHYHRFDMDQVKRIFPHGQYEIIDLWYRRCIVIIENQT